MDDLGVKIRYGDVAPEAKENFTPTVSEMADFVDLSQLQKYNLKFANYGNPCEYGAVLLDGKSLPPPPRYAGENTGLWSVQISQSDGTFETPIILTLTADAQYSSQGFTLTFDTFNNIFCNALSIVWYRGETQLAAADFTPNSAFYFCRKQVENFDRVIITFKKMNMPYNRLKLRVIDYGYGTYFRADELRSVNVIQELHPIAAELPTGTVDFVLDSNTDMEYSFQSKQPLSVYFNGTLRATTFVTSSKRQGKYMWKVESEDYVGQLARLTFLGNIYTNENAYNLLSSIFTQAKIPFTISDDLKTETVTGYIPICDCREAVRQICFAIGAVCSTANSDTVNIHKLSDTVTQEIPLSRIRTGQSFEEDDRVTSVVITAHQYRPIGGDTDNLVEAYKASESGTGTNILVKFTEPLWQLSIKDGEILQSCANYAIINANAETCVLKGYRYEDVQTQKVKNNPVVSASDLENVVEISDATLVSSANADAVLNRVYDYVTKRTTTTMKINEGYHMVKWGEFKWGEFVYGGKVFDDIVNVGDVITAQTEYIGAVTGRITSERYNLNGGIVVKECELI